MRVTRGEGFQINCSTTVLLVCQSTQLFNTYLWGPRKHSPSWNDQGSSQIPHSTRHLHLALLVYTLLPHGWRHRVSCQIWRLYPSHATSWHLLPVSGYPQIFWGVSICLPPPIQVLIYHSSSSWYGRSCIFILLTHGWRIKSMWWFSWFSSLRVKPRFKKCFLS